MIMIRFFLAVMLSLFSGACIFADSPEESSQENSTLDLRYIELQDIQLEEPVYEESSTFMKYCKSAGIWCMVRMMKTHEWCRLWFQHMMVLFKNNKNHD